MPGNTRKILELAEGICQNTFKQFNLLQGKLEEESLQELLSLLEERGNMMALVTKIRNKGGADRVKRKIDELFLKTRELDKQNIKVLKDKQGDILSKLKDLHIFKKGHYAMSSLQASGAFIDQKK